MKKALGQTVRDLKREVNKKVLKVPGIEQKVLDSTSNEPWGPHGSLLADIAHATKNYHEYQMIMAVIWKRINDTGKNWRHVYKALTVLEYLVANGSERVIDEIREHAYQISTLSDFQYIDSGGRDQGSNVRKKSQSLVLLVNDKERIQEVRQKAAANRDKFRNTSSTGGMYRPDRPDDDRYEGRYGSRDEDRNGYGRERDDDRYGRYGDSYGRDGDRYGRDSEERYGRDGYRDDDYRGRSRSIDEYQYGSRSRSSDRDRAYDEDGNYSSRGSGARADENSVEGRGLERKFSEQSLGAPPSYEEAVGDARSPVHNDRDGETSAPSAPKPSSPPVSTSPSQATTGLDTSASPVNQEFDSFDEFDPRGGSVPAAPAAPATSNTPETDLLGALSDALAIVPTTSEADVPANSGSTFGASSFGNQSFEDPFGDSPFKAIPSTNNIPAQSQSFPPTSFQATTNQTFEPQPPVTTTNTETASNFDFGDTFPGITYSSSSDPNTDILAGILPPSGSSAPITSQSSFPEPAQQPIANVGGGFGSTPPVSSYMPPQPFNGGPFQTQSGPTPLMAPPQHNNGLYGSQFSSAGPAPSQSQFGSVGPVPSQSQFGSVGQVPSQSQFGSAGPVQSHFGSAGPVPSQFGSAGPVPSQFGSAGPVPSQFGSAGPVPSQMARPAQQHNNDVLGNIMGPASPSPASSVGPLAIVPVQPTKEKFETKSTVWADTLSRGLVDLNISGVKTNPLADIGIDFDAINRKEKRMEKPTTAPVVSTINMGKAMGSGSGMGRAGASAIRPPANPMMAPGMGMGMGAGYGGMSQSMGGMGMGMGAGYGGMSQPMGGMGMNMGGMGMGMNMGMGQGHPMQPPTGMPPGPPTMQGGYNPMMGGGGGYAPQQPYGGGYR